MEVASDGRLFVCLQGGSLRVIKNGALLPTPFLSLTVNSSGERGLLGIAFDPNFATNNYLYLYYTVASAPIHNRISRFTANGDVVVAGSEMPILDLENLSATNHNGGAIHFGPDGKLYVAVGENAVPSNAQTLNNRLGKMLRINSDGSIPNDNPFFNTAQGDNRSIWALGLRNPFTFAFQPGTGRVFINDVGQSAWEEINDGIAGANYGWPNNEGPTSDPNFRAPLFAYNHAIGATGGCAIAGGAFYNPANNQFPATYTGRYFFADLCSGWIRVLNPGDNTASGFASGISSPVDLKVTDEGSLYYLARGSSSVFRVQYSPALPSITTHPTSQTVASGQPVTFTVAATGSTPFSYQWQRNMVNIPGATSASYTIASTTFADNGAKFRCVVTNALGNATSNEATLTVNAPPTITTHPASQTIAEGQPVTFTLAATGSTSLSYQWQRNMVNIPGAISASYTIASTTFADNGPKFRCVVTNAFGNATSNEATLTVNAPPSITTHPASQTIAEGQPVTFTVAATGSTPFTYQWQRNMVNISGAISSSYTIASTTFADNGAKFRCVVTNALGNATSNEATLTVNAPPSITTHPASQTIAEGQPVTFTVAASGSTPFSYQWQRNMVNIPGAISASYTIASTTFTDNDAKFRCVVTNSFGNATSDEATLTVNAPPSITTHPASQTIAEGQPVTFTVAATGSTPFSYQWQRNMVNISGATSSSYTIASTTFADNDAKFRCVVTNAFGNATSNEATLTVHAPPSITTHPASQTMVEGQPVTFTVAATGSTPLSYQWQRNMVNISGATSSSYTIASTTFADNGAKFRCVVTNAFGNATSNEATLTVNAPPSITTHPASQTIAEGQPVTFTVAATGSTPFSYQWQRNMVNIPGATSSSYTIASTTFVDNGAKFRCVVTNAFGNATSNEATLTVNAPPTITTHPASQTIAEGQPVTFTVAASGSTPFSYQWQRNMVNISGAISSSYTIASTTFADNGAKFRCVVTNAFGNATTNEATLTVNAPPPLLLTEENTDIAIALSSVSAFRDPFSLIDTANFSSDNRTRVILFGMNLDLLPGENASAVTGQAEDAQLNVYPLTIEFVGKVPNFDWLTQVIVRLPDNLPTGQNVWVRLTLHGRTSNQARFRIR